MTKYMPLLAVVLTVVSIQASTIPKENAASINNNAGNLTFIGSIRTQVSAKSRSGAQTYQQSMYYRSSNSAPWHEARQDCKDFLGGALLQIETQEELANVTRFLDSGSTTTVYWLGGQYDIFEERFQWLNGVPLSPNAPWMKNYPNMFNSLTKVEAYTVGGIRYRTAMQDTTRRYLCEVVVGEIEEQPEPCYSDNQLVIIVDSSGSIGQQNYNTALEFAARLATAWADNPKSSI